MDQKAAKRIEELAPSIQNFLELEDEEQKWLFPLFSPGIKTTLETLALIAETSMTYEDIAYAVGMHPNTVKTKLLALKRGGFPLNLSDRCAIAETGRKRVLAKSDCFTFNAHIHSEEQSYGK